MTKPIKLIGTFKSSIGTKVTNPVAILRMYVIDFSTKVASVSWLIFAEDTAEKNLQSINLFGEDDQIIPQNGSITSYDKPQEDSTMPIDGDAAPSVNGHIIMITRLKQLGYEVE